jgi:hypothetical protein
MTTTPDTQPHGNFIAFLLREKEPGDKHPMFEGRLSLPDDPKVEYGFPLFAHEYTDPKTGEVMTMFNGGTDPVSLNAAPMDQIAALLKGADANTALASVGSLQLRPGQLVLFPNRFKDEAPDKERPDYWGAYNHGNNQPAIRIGAWLRKDRYGRAMFGGSTSYPLSGKSDVEQQDLSPTLEQLEQEGKVTRGMPEKAKKRGGGRAD